MTTFYHILIPVDGHFETHCVQMDLRLLEVVKKKYGKRVKVEEKETLEVSELDKQQ